MGEFKTYGFMQDKDWYEDVGHIVLGYLPIDMLWYIREHTTLKLPWPFKGQYPPGDILKVLVGPRAGEFFPTDRVHDSKRDELGRSIGAQLRVITLIALLIWRW